MKKNNRKIPIIAATALFSLMSAGCAERFTEADSPTALSETTEEQTLTETVASAAKKTTSKKNTSSQKKKTTAATTTAESGIVTESTDSVAKPSGLLASLDDLEIYDTDGMDTDYEFIYDGKIFEAVYTPENWKIIDSYKIRNRGDMTIICTALSKLHPIHDKDYTDYRTPEDMAYEWEQHNIAYSLLSDSNDWKASAKDVDLNPDDQGKSIYDFYKERSGRDIFSALW